MHGSSGKQNGAYKKKKATSKVQEKKEFSGCFQKGMETPPSCFAFFFSNKPNLFSLLDNFTSQRKNENQKLPPSFSLSTRDVPKQMQKPFPLLNKEIHLRSLLSFLLLLTKCQSFSFLFSCFSLFFRPSSRQPFFTLDQRPFVGRNGVRAS